MQNNRLIPNQNKHLEIRQISHSTISRANSKCALYMATELKEDPVCFDYELIDHFVLGKARALGFRLPACQDKSLEDTC